MRFAHTFCQKGLSCVRLGAMVGSCLTVWICTALICANFSVFPSSAAVMHDPPFCFAIEQFCDNGESLGVQSSVYAQTGLSIEQGQTVSLRGWFATEEGVECFEYAWLEHVGDPLIWQKASYYSRYARHDLFDAGIPYASGHDTAGFYIECPAPDSLENGYYDIYIRCITSNGYACDMLALLDVAYGNPDTDNGERYIINLSRLAAAPAEHLINTEQRNGLLEIHADSAIRLGDALDLCKFESVTVTYTVSSDFATETEGRHTLLGLKASARPYGQAGEKYDMSDSLAYRFLSEAKQNGPTRTLTMDLSDCLYNGEVWLTGYFDTGTVKISDISFTYNGCAYETDPVTIRMTGELATYLSGYNKVEASTVNDDVYGEVMRISLTEDTNDPYVYMDSGSLLRNYGISLSADSYKYMVVTARTAAYNKGSSMTFYLCAGSITSATEQCTYTYAMTTDGQWHTYVLDLSQQETWSGRINGWRLDVINGESHAGNTVDFASIQLFTDESQACAAAQNPPTNYEFGQPFVGMDKTGQSAQAPETVSPEDILVETLLPAETVATVTHAPETTFSETFSTEMVSALPSNTDGSARDTSTDTLAKPSFVDPSVTTAPPSEGCGSSINLDAGVELMLPGLLLAATALAVYRRHKPRTIIS